ncbi:hypothetical protein AGRA3207_002142 [Actinomadura graeca]|uniref:Cysteine dioxygenase type I n=1 Tax=Actinomadura graeca TaxID=2750812 RepID=A0ABX8QRP7_9ACTN|nr:hypothetical protein [Actinomadura graeca]QXJ21303.1 hypothetical protein AGRA3207_002142 [Actinomadura graeca]
MDLVAETAALAGVGGGSRADPPMRSRGRIHANGFLKLILVAADEWSVPGLAGHKLVMHVWDESTAGRSENVHDHRWSFWSTLVCGRLRWESYSLSGDPSAEPSHIEFEYRSPGDADRYAMLPKRRVPLECDFMFTAPAGATFRMSENELHRVTRADTDISATLFLQGAPVRDTTRVYMPVSVGPHEREGSFSTVAVEEKASLLSSDSLRRLLEGVLEGC